jgi:hypothetical protein
MMMMFSSGTPPRLRIWYACRSTGSAQQWDAAVRELGSLYAFCCQWDPCCEVLLAGAGLEATLEDKRCGYSGSQLTHVQLSR